MTGAGLGRSSDGLWVEMKSTNAKGLDIVLKLPDGLILEEDLLRRTLGKSIVRGRIEVRAHKGRAKAPLQKELVALHRELKGHLKILGRSKEQIPLSVLFSLLADRGPKEFDRRGLAEFRSCVRGALAQLIGQRIREGTRLRSDIVKRLARLKRDVGRGKKLSALSARKNWQRIKAKANKIRSIRADKSQMATEEAMVLLRGDVSEEITRILVHIDEFSRTISRDRAPGRRLGFLCQELQREIQTFTSKSQDSLVSKLGVDLKESLEQIREQVQNLE